MQHYSGAGAWNLIPFVGGVKAQDKADTAVAGYEADQQKSIEAQAAAESELGEALARREEAKAKDEKRKAEQEAHFFLESGVRRYEQEARGRLFGSDYTTTLDALGNEEIQLAQDEIDTLTANIKDEQRDNIPETKFPFALAGGLLAVSAGLYWYQTRSK